MYVRVSGRYAPSRVAPQEFFILSRQKCRDRFFIFLGGIHENVFADKTMVILISDYQISVKEWLQAEADDYRLSRHNYN